jgi:hypothetical protein
MLLLIGFILVALPLHRIGHELCGRRSACQSQPTAVYQAVATQSNRRLNELLLRWNAARRVVILKDRSLLTPTRSTACNSGILRLMHLPFGAEQRADLETPQDRAGNIRRAVRRDS